MEEIYPEYKEKTLVERILSKSPLALLGIAGSTLIVGHGIYKFRSRKVSPALFLINYRLAAQGTFVGCLAVVMVYNIFNDHIWKRIRKEQSPKESES